MLFRLTSTAIKLATAGPLQSFIQAQSFPEATQSRTLQRHLTNLAMTEYGRNFGIKAGAPYAQFANTIPIATYDSLLPWLDQQRQFENGALTSEKVAFYEKTSGSSGRAKLIPYTPGLQRTFHRMFLLWLADILRMGIPFASGKAFIAISPQRGPAEFTAAGRPIGLSDDREYLNPLSRFFLQQFFVSPRGISSVDDDHLFKLALACSLVAAEDLEIISVWHPTYFLEILSFIACNWGEIQKTLAKRSLQLPGRTLRLPAVNFKPRGLDSRQIDIGRLWPRLRFISAWDSAHAHRPAQLLRSQFPQAQFQGKGLLAPEAPLTVPIHLASGYLPLLQDIFFEFEDGGGDIRLLHQLEKDREYQVIVSTPGGLSRYRLGDRVRCDHFFRKTPCLTFMGKTSSFCDLVGEKLDEKFVRTSLAQVFGQSRFYTMTPEIPDQAPPFYRLFISGQRDDDLLTLTSAAERALCQSYHYGLARRHGQLGPVKIQCHPEAERLYFDCFLRNGKRWGDIKSYALHSDITITENLLGQATWFC